MLKTICKRKQMRWCIPFAVLSLITVFSAGSPSAAVIQPLTERDVDVVWSTSDDQRQEIYYANKTEGLWTEPVRITDDYYDNMYPVIDRDSSGRRWVFWSAYSNGSMELRYTTGENGNWAEGETLAAEMTTNISPSVIIDKDDTVWVVWSANDGELDDIYFAVNEKGSWSSPANLHESNSVADMLPEIEFDGSGRPSVSWRRLHDGKPTVVTSRLTDNQWSEPEVMETIDTTDQEDGETLELPSFINNSSMVFVRIY